MMRKLVLIAMALAGTGCAQQAPLTPVAGASLPPAPYGAKSVPDAEALLTPTVQAMPVRNDELRSRSEERADDPFDLPPQDEPDAKPKAMSR